MSAAVAARTRSRFLQAWVIFLCSFLQSIIQFGGKRLYVGKIWRYLSILDCFRVFNGVMQKILTRIGKIHCIITCSGNSWYFCNTIKFYNLGIAQMFLDGIGISLGFEIK